MKKINLIIISIISFILLDVNEVYAKEIINKRINDNVSYEDSDNSNDINRGDVVKIGTEEFYVLLVNDDNTIDLFPKMNVDATTYLQASNATKVNILIHGDNAFEKMNNLEDDLETFTEKKSKLI